MKVCLHALMKNEVGRIERLLASCVDHVSCVHLHDTGSTDATIAIAEAFLRERDIPYYISRGSFYNFSQARNQALRECHIWLNNDPTIDADWILLLDADMTLGGPFPSTTGSASGDLEGTAYTLTQLQGSLSYPNTRLLRTTAKAHYVGVTHEFLAVEDVQHLDRPVLLDHADGGTRGEKYERDKRLLEAALKTEQNEGLKARYQYYLAQTLYEMGKLAHAANAWAKRATMGGYHEEAWHARYKVAQCLYELKDKRFLGKAWEAYAADPSRGEPIYLIAKYHLDRGEHDAACAAAEQGLALGMPTEAKLFLDDWVHRIGFKEVLAICSFYSQLPQRKERGKLACTGLTTTHGADKDQALRNMVHYAEVLADSGRLDEVMPLNPSNIPDGFTASTPSVTVVDGKLKALVRCVNYTYDQAKTWYTPTDGTDTIRTVNLLCDLDDAGQVLRAVEVLDRSRVSSYEQCRIRGYEDLRLIAHKGNLLVAGTVCDKNDEEQREFCLADLSSEGELTHLRVNRTIELTSVQKNWMPVVVGNSLCFVYKVSPTYVVSWDGAQPKLDRWRQPISHDLSLLRGGSQLVNWLDGWVALTHEVAHLPEGCRHYLHRWVRFGPTLAITGVSAPFFFKQRGTEYCTGLTRHRGKFWIGFSVGDKEAWLGVLDERRLPALEPVRNYEPQPQTWQFTM